jgi:hypothetical protein
MGGKQSKAVCLYFNTQFQQMVSEMSVSRELTEIVMRDGFERQHLRKYCVGIDARYNHTHNSQWYPAAYHSIH